MPHVVKLNVPQALLPLARFAQLLQTLEGQRHAADAHQYRVLAGRVTAELREQQAHEALPSLLNHFPVAAELYENLQYAHAGLVRAPLEVSLTSELAARDLLVRMRRG